MAAAAGRSGSLRAALVLVAALSALAACLGAARSHRHQQPSSTRRSLLSTINQESLEASKGVGSYHPVLSDTAIARGLASLGTQSRLRRFALKLRRGQPVSVVLLGGSITCGNGAGPGGKPWRVVFEDWLRQAFPLPEAAGGRHSVHNGCQQATTSAVYAVCLQEFLPHQGPAPDLVVVEFALNDHPDSTEPAVDNPNRRAYEQLLRRVLQLEGRPAVVALQHYGWRNSAGLFYDSAENTQSILAQYYDIPVLSVRNALYHILRGNDLDGFRVESKDPEALYFSDGNHPRALGHRVLADLLIAAILRAPADAAELEVDVPKDSIPPPMFQGNYESGSPLCVMPYAAKADTLEQLVIESSGFAYQPQRPQEPSVRQQKWGWVGEAPGSWLVLSLDTRVVVPGRVGSSDGAQALQAAQQANGAATTEVLLMHVKSFQGMGTAIVSCVQNCKCPEAQLEGRWGRKATLTDTSRVQVTQHSDCRIQVRITAAEGLPSSSSSNGMAGNSSTAGSKVVLVGLMIVQPGSRMEYSNVGQWS